MMRKLQQSATQIFQHNLTEILWRYYGTDSGRKAISVLVRDELNGIRDNQLNRVIELLNSRFEFEDDTDTNCNVSVVLLGVNCNLVVCISLLGAYYMVYSINDIGMVVIGDNVKQHNLAQREVIEILRVHKYQCLGLSTLIQPVKDFGEINGGDITVAGALFGEDFQELLALGS